MGVFGVLVELDTVAVLSGTCVLVIEVVCVEVVGLEVVVVIKCSLSKSEHVALVSDNPVM